MTTFVYTHAICIDHDPGSGHPERPDRLRSVSARLKEMDIALLEAPLAERHLITRVHPSTYVSEVLDAVPMQGTAHLDPDTALSPATGEAALRAAGGVCAAVDGVAEGKSDNAFCAVRPPGHHAEPARAMGFCVFNNVAIGAMHARVAHGFQRVAVIDFDVHHGNGTQAAFWDDGDAFYGSSHQSPAYPGSGAASETGGHGNIVNVPLAPYSGSEEFRAAYSDTLLTALRGFDPDFLFISAGFDAHAADPLAQLNVQTEDFAWVTDQLAQLARAHCEGRVVSVLEGGYDLGALTDGVEAHIRALMEY